MSPVDDELFKMMNCSRNKESTATAIKGVVFNIFVFLHFFTELGYAEPRLCDYSGFYYCQRCHWNGTSVIPARVIRNWDMEPRKVSQAASQLLALLYDKPVLILEKLNPKLFTLVPDLSLIKVSKAF